MKVLYIAVECKPFAKVGGVGDVAGELPAALRDEGVDIEIATPLYVDKMTGKESLRPGGLMSQVTENGIAADVPWLRGETRGIPVHFLDCPSKFRGDIYVNSPPERPYWDDAVKFSFFSEACLDLIEVRNPDIVHVNDWPLGYLLGRMITRGFPQGRVLTIHNVQYQGNFFEGLIPAGSILGRVLSDHPAAFRDPHPTWRSVNALRLAIESADRVNTVSPCYAREISLPSDESRFFIGAAGLESVTGPLYPKQLVGILNGFEYMRGVSDSEFEATLAGKAAARRSVVGEFTDPAGLLLGFVGRAVEQKVRLLKEELRGKSVLEHILEIPGVNVALLGTGAGVYEDFLKNIPCQRNGVVNFSATIRFDQSRAALISLGSDVFLMPSLFEPCGITQLESMSNATPPLVRHTGGLADTVVPHTSHGGTGFVFEGNSRDGVLQALVDSVRAAARLFRDDPAAFAALKRNAFRQRFVWSDSAQRYLRDLYQPAASLASLRRS
jgi:starch synthase